MVTFYGNIVDRIPITISFSFLFYDFTSALPLQKSKKPSSRNGAKSKPFNYIFSSCYVFILDQFR